VADLGFFRLLAPGSNVRLFVYQSSSGRAPAISAYFPGTGNSNDKGDKRYNELTF